MDLRASMAVTEKLNTNNSKAEVIFSKISADEVARIAIHASHERNSWLKNNVTSKEFVLVEIPLSSVAILENPSGKLDLRAALDTTPLFIDINKRRQGRTNSGFIPSVIVIEGAARHTAARLNGKNSLKAWVGIEAAKVLKIYADHQFGAQELNSKIQEQLRQKLVKKKGNGETIGPYPWVSEVYPFENYFIYSYDGDLYKQQYKCDIKKRTVTFTGDAEQVIQKYVDLNAKQTPMEKAMKMSAMPTTVSAPSMDMKQPSMSAPTLKMSTS